MGRTGLLVGCPALLGLGLLLEVGAGHVVFGVAINEFAVGVDSGAGWFFADEEGEGVSGLVIQTFGVVLYHLGKYQRQSAVRNETLSQTAQK